MNTSRCIIFFLTMVLLTFSGCQSATSSGSTDLDGDDSVVDGDEDHDSDYDIENDFEVDTSDGDNETDVDSEREDSPIKITHIFNCFAAAGGTATSDDHRLTFRLAPAAMLVESSNDSLLLKSTITVK